MRGRDRKSSTATQLWPFIQRRIGDWASPSGAGGTGAYAPSPHDLSSSHHSGTLDDTQFPTGLLCDGTRALTGNLAVSPGVTVDGVDISVLAGAYVAHAAGSAYAGHAGGMGSHTHQAAGIEGGTLDHGLALTGLGDDDHTIYLKEKAAGGTAAETPVHTHQAAGECGTLDHGLALTGLGDDDHTIYALTPGTLTVATTNLRSSGGAHYHAVTSSANPGAAAALLASAPTTGLLQLTGLGLGTPGAAGTLNVLGTGTQATLYYDLTHYGTLTVDGAGGLMIGAVAGLDLAPAGDLTLDPGGNDVLPGTGYDINLGALTCKYLTLHAAELWVETLVAQNTIATIGGRILIGPTTVLTADLDGTDLMLNGGFEIAGGGGADVFTNWVENAGTGTVINETTVVFEGSHAARLTAGAADDTYIRQDMTCLAAARYDLTIHQRSGSAGFPGKYAIYDVTNSGYIVAKTALTSSPMGYLRQDIFFTTPAGCVTVRVYLWSPGSSGKIAYFDGVSLLPGRATVKYSQMTSGDTAYLEANGHVEFLGIRSAAGGGGPFTYDAARNLDRTGANDWAAGDAVFNTGAAGDGFIDLYSVSGVLSGAGPTIVGNVRDSATFNDWAPHWAIGNLNALYGYGVTTYGVGLGQYASGKANITIDPTNGLRLRSYTTEILSIKNADGKGYITGPLYLDTAGGIYQGTGTFAAPTTGLKVWNDGGIGRIGGYNASVLQWYADTDGRLYAGAGAVTLDADGIAIALPAAHTASNSLQFLYGGVLYQQLTGEATASINYGYWLAGSFAGKNSALILNATSPNTKTTRVQMSAVQTGLSGLYAEVVVDTAPRFDVGQVGAAQVFSVYSASGDVRTLGGLILGSVTSDPPAGALCLTDGITAPGTLAGFGVIFIDTADGDLKIRFGDGTLKTIVVDT